MMNGYRKILVLLCMLFFGMEGMVAQDISAFVDSSQFLLGDHIHVKLRADVDDILSVKEVNPLDIEASGIEFIKITPWVEKNENSKKYYLSEVIFIGFDSGAFYVPEIEVIMDSGTSTDKEEVTRKIPVFVGGDSLQVAELMGNKGLHYEAVRWQDYLPLMLTILGLLIVVFGIWYWMKYRPKKLEEEYIAPLIPADIWAMDSLDELKQQALWQNGEVKEYYSKLSEILRGFLERKYDFGALEMTTKEIVKDIRKQRKTDFPLASTRDILEVSDMVKFAKYKPEEDVHDSYWEKTKNLVFAIHELDPPIIEQEEIKKEEEE